MKNILYIFILTTLSCNNQSKQTEKTPITITADQLVENQKTENSKYYTAKDTVFIETETKDTLQFAKAEFNNIIDTHSELFQEFPENPDNLYSHYGSSHDFGSELGQDAYYVLYAYFLKQRNGIDKYAEQRKKLIKIYSNINSLFGHFQYGGTYFGHQSSRILGYAEYSVYLYPKGDKTYDVFEKIYDITKQKELYIKSLRQLIEDESKIDFETQGKEKMERLKKLNKMVDELNHLITNIFYLRRAQEFQYGHYQYY